MADLWKLTAAQVRAAVLAGDLLLETYVKSLLQRIDARDANVQAWACLDREYALSEARRQDEIPPAQRGPLHGFVIGVKDIMLTKGNPQEPHRASSSCWGRSIGPQTPYASI